MSLMVRWAIRSAASTARRMARSASSMLTIGAGADAAGKLVADAQNLQLCLSSVSEGAVLGGHGFGDEAADLGRADIEGGDEATLGNGRRRDPPLPLNCTTSSTQTPNLVRAGPPY